MITVPLFLHITAVFPFEANGKLLCDGPVMYRQTDNSSYSSNISLFELPREGYSFDLPLKGLGDKLKTFSLGKNSRVHLKEESAELNVYMHFQRGSFGENSPYKDYQRVVSLLEEDTRWKKISFHSKKDHEQSGNGPVDYLFPG